MNVRAGWYLWVCVAGLACGDSATTADGPGATAGAGGAGPVAPGGAGLPPDLPVYVQPTRACRAPLPEEPAGASEGGLVCTWQSVAGATEEGRRFRDYADCDVVRTQRPYYPMPPSPTYRAETPRMGDARYAGELDWVRGQVDAVGCSCCHSDSAPGGPVRWSIDLPGDWATSLSDRDVAALADWIDTSMFERFPPETNNGFQRPHGLPSRDPGRVKAFFEAEAAQRGLTREDFADAPPTGGPLLEQAAYVPGPCAAGEGVDRDGVLSWAGGPARYIYVMNVGSKNPSVPPDRDLPAGTLWRVDVPPAAEPLLPGGVRYGELPGGAAQRFPAAGPPEGLAAGGAYYLYVSRDMFQPITRCLFTMP
ncbi:MAG TPA: proteinase inhibitor [Polyangiaceae bacterium]|nr:proteinase inhibitor [Polyangiaceae bacterium]